MLDTAIWGIFPPNASNLMKFHDGDGEKPYYIINEIHMSSGTVGEIQGSFTDSVKQMDAAVPHISKSLTILLVHLAQFQRAIYR